MIIPLQWWMQEHLKKKIKSPTTSTLTLCCLPSITWMEQYLIISTRNGFITQGKHQVKFSSSIITQRWGFESFSISISMVVEGQMVGESSHRFQEQKLWEGCRNQSVCWVKSCFILLEDYVFIHSFSINSVQSLIYLH